jgi:hypothetical protein
MSDAVRCSWCTRLFRPRRGGHAQRFCRPACRRAFHAAARAWVLDAIASGALTLADIRGSAATRGCSRRQKGPYRRFKPIMALAMSSVLAFLTASSQTLNFVS